MQCLPRSSDSKMWSWTEPVAEFLQTFLSSIWSPYIENLDSDKLRNGLKSGQLALRNLRLRRSALDKFRLPVAVLEGHLGQLTLSIPWTNLSSKPVELLIENICILVATTSNTRIDPEHEEHRAQARKVEKLEHAELFSIREKSEQLFPQGFVAFLISKIVNNLQITVKSIHIRYEDSISRPDHPFSAGVTLARFTLKSVDENWLPTPIHSSVGPIYKLARLESLAIYFDTDSPGVAKLPVGNASGKPIVLVSSDHGMAEHQFILKPVNGEGRITINNQINKSIPKTDVQLFFDEIGSSLNDYQYRNVISLVEMYHGYLRRYKYRHYAPDQDSLNENRPRALIQFAGRAILGEIQERNKKHTFTYIKEVAENRRAYMALFRKMVSNLPTPEDISSFESLERKLSYEDITLYRSLTRRRIREDTIAAHLQKDEQASKTEDNRQSKVRDWDQGGWRADYRSFISTSGHSSFNITRNLWHMTDEQRNELYEAIGYHSGVVSGVSGDTSPDALKLRIVTKLARGSFDLKSSPPAPGQAAHTISLVVDHFNVDVTQSSDSLEAALTLKDFRIFDATTDGSAYPPIVRVGGVQSSEASEMAIGSPPADSDALKPGQENPFFSLKFTNKPSNTKTKADNALSVHLRHMEIVYHRGYIEVLDKFFQAPGSQIESFEALLRFARETLDELREETRQGLGYASEPPKTISIQLDVQVPIITIPEGDVTVLSRHLVLDILHGLLIVIFHLLPV